MQWNSENLIGNKYARGGHGGGGGTRGDCEVSELEEERELALQWTGEAEGTLFMSRHNGGFRSTVLVLRSLARARDEHLCRQLLLFFLLSELTKRRVL